MVKYGYARVSSTGQKLDRQIKALKDYGVEERDIFVEKKSGKNTTMRPELQKVVAKVHREDELVVLSLDRLSRNYDDVSKLIQQVRENEAKLTVIDAPFLQMETGNPTLDKFVSDMLIGILAYVAQNEREKNHERQRQGIEIAKKKGAFKGRPAKYAPDAKTPERRVMYGLICDGLDAGMHIADIARKYQVLRQQVYRIQDKRQFIKLAAKEAAEKLVADEAKSKAKIQKDA